MTDAGPQPAAGFAKRLEDAMAHRTRLQGAEFTPEHLSVAMKASVDRMFRAQVIKAMPSHLRALEQADPVSFEAHVRRQMQQYHHHQVKVPTSPRMIRYFLDGDRVPLSVDFARHAAAVLGVRFEWLHYFRGEKTDAKPEALATNNSVALPYVVTRDGFDPIGTRDAIADIAKPIADYRAGLALFMDVWDRLMRSSSNGPPERGQQQIDIARDLWKCIEAPLALVGTAPELAPQTYYITVLGALLSAMPAQGKGRTLRAEVPIKKRRTTRRTS